MFAFFLFTLLVKTPLVKPVSREVGPREAFPIPSDRTRRREAETGATVLEIVPKDPQKELYVGHYNAGEGDGQQRTSSQPELTHEDLYAGHDEAKHEGDGHTHNSSHQGPSVSVVKQGDAASKIITTRRPAQSAHRDREKVSVLCVLFT